MPQPRKKRRASRRLGTKRKKAEPLSEAVKTAKAERKRKLHRKLDAKRRNEVKASGGGRITAFVSAETKHKLSELCRTSGLSQQQVLAACVQHTTTRDVVNINPPKPQTAARIAAVRKRLLSIKELP